MIKGYLLTLFDCISQAISQEVFGLDFGDEVRGWFGVWLVDCTYMLTYYTVTHEFLMMLFSVTIWCFLQTRSWRNAFCFLAW